MVLLQARDPIPQFRDFVLKQSILSEAQIKDIDKEVEAIVDDAVKFADESPKPVSHPSLMLSVYITSTWAPPITDAECSAHLDMGPGHCCVPSIIFHGVS